MSVQDFLRGSTWGYPILSAIHVLGVAWFGGTVLIAQFAPDLRKLRRVGIGLLLLTGAVLFWLQPTRYYGSISFWVKMLLLVVLLRVKPASVLSLAIWTAVIFASRGIAFW